MTTSILHSSVGLSNNDNNSNNSKHVVWREQEEDPIGIHHQQYTSTGIEDVDARTCVTKDTKSTKSTAESTVSIDSTKPTPERGIPPHLRNKIVANIFSDLDVKYGNSLPRLFILLPAATVDSNTTSKSGITACSNNTNGNTTKSNTKSSWFRQGNEDTPDSNLYFVCAHTLKAIDPPIQLRWDRTTMEKIAPVYAVSLYLLESMLRTKVSPTATESTIEFSNQPGYNNKFRIGDDQIRIMRFQVFQFLQASTYLDMTKLYSEFELFVDVLSTKAYDDLAVLARKQPLWRKNIVPVQINNQNTKTSTFDETTLTSTIWIDKSTAKDTFFKYKQIK